MFFRIKIVSSLLFYRYTFCQIPWHIYIQSLIYCHIIGKYLEW